jgi:hypothetical protein
MEKNSHLPSPDSLLSMTGPFSAWEKTSFPCTQMRCVFARAPVVRMPGNGLVVGALPSTRSVHELSESA